jgi:hypothetical protein
VSEIGEGFQQSSPVAQLGFHGAEVGHGDQESGKLAGLGRRLNPALGGHLHLEGLSGGLALLHGAEPGLDPLGEQLAGLALNPLNLFLHPAIGADAEADGLLCHPRPEQEWGDASRVARVLG